MILGIHDVDPLDFSDLNPGVLHRCAVRDAVGGVEQHPQAAPVRHAHRSFHPALDGGRLLMIGLEKIVGRKRVAKVEKYVNAVGMFLLLALLIGVTVKDLFFN